MNYTVADGDYSAHLDYVNENSLGVGTYIRDYAGNNSIALDVQELYLLTHQLWSRKNSSNNVDKSLSNAATGGSFEIDGLTVLTFQVQLRL